MSYGYTAIIPIFFLVVVLAFKKLRHDLMSALKERVFFRYLFRENFLVFLLILSFIALLMCQTRGQIVGVLVGIPVVFFFKNKKSFYFLLVTSIFLISLAAAYTYKFGNPNSRIFKSLNSVNHSQRLSQAKVGMHLFFDNPFFGAGFSSIEERDSKVKEKYNISDKDFVGHAHNNFIEILATTGLLGFAFFILWIFFWIKEVLAIQSVGLRSFFIALITGFLVTGLFQSTFIDSEYSFSLFALYGLSFVALEYERF
jgi:O-antigen ligase